MKGLAAIDDLHFGSSKYVLTCPAVTEIPKLRKKLQSWPHVKSHCTEWWPRRRSAAGTAARRKLANRRRAADCNDFCGDTSQTFTIHRPQICSNFEFELQKRPAQPPPRCPRQRWHFYLLTRLPRAAPRCCTPSNTQNTYYMFVYWHSSFFCAGISLFRTPLSVLLHMHD